MSYLRENCFSKQHWLDKEIIQILTEVVCNLLVQHDLHMMAGIHTVSKVVWAFDFELLKQPKGVNLSLSIDSKCPEGFVNLCWGEKQICDTCKQWNRPFSQNPSKSYTCLSFTTWLHLKGFKVLFVTWTWHIFPLCVPPYSLIFKVCKSKKNGWKYNICVYHCKFDTLIRGI